MPSRTKDVQIVTRMEGDVVALLDRFAAERGESRAELVRQAITAYVNRLRSESDALIYEKCPQTADEMMGGAAVAWAGLPPWEDDAPW